MKQMITQNILTSLVFVFHIQPAVGNGKQYLDLDNPEYVLFISKAALDNIDINENREQLQRLLENHSSFTESDSSAKIRQLEVLVLGASSPPRASYKDIIKFFTDPSDDVRAQAARVMRFMGQGQRMDPNESPTREATHSIVDLWADPSPKVRREAIGSFFRFGANYSSQLKTLLKIVESDPDMDVRMSALKALRGWPHPHKISRLSKKIDRAEHKLNIEKARLAGDIPAKGRLACLRKFLGLSK